MSHDARRSRLDRNPERMLFPEVVADDADERFVGADPPPEQPSRQHDPLLVICTGEDSNGPAYCVAEVPPHAVDTHPFAAMLLIDDEWEPVSDGAFQTLPAWARAKLDVNGYVKCRGVFDSAVGEFRELSYGWGGDQAPTANRLGELLEQLDGHPLRAVYYFLHEYASDPYSDPAAIAELRGIKQSSVEDEIRAAESVVDD